MTLRGTVADPNQMTPIGLNGGRLAEALEDIIAEKDGDAQIRRIKVSQELIKEGQPLSRLWINGRLGGVPDLI